MTRLLKTREVSTIIGYSPASVRAMCENGKLSGHKPNGGHWRVTLESVERFIGRIIERKQNPQREKDADIRRARAAGINI